MLSLIHIFSEQQDIFNNKEAIRKYCNSILNQTLSQAIAAFNLLKLRHFDTILDNTIRLGMPAIQRQILYEKEIEHRCV